jgi:thiol-disulfide isomerase/thioredoxin
MKLKTILAVFAASLLAATTVPAQNFTNAELSGLVQQVSAKLKAGENTEAALAPELKQFDALLAAQKGVKTVEAAEIIYMKAMLYLQVFNNTDKGGELMRTLKDDYAGTKYGQSAAKIIDQIAKQSSAKKVQSALGTGLAFPDFAEKDLDGKPLSVGDHKGKVVLVDFWATWCGPCRAELPNVIAAYKKYHDQGFDIIGVSLDSDRAKLDAFLKKTEGMTWPQFFDGEGWANKLAVKYGVESIPFTVLVGPDGKIIGKDLRGDDLVAAVAKALGK